MRCVCCNKVLSSFESCLKHPVTGEYLDICQRCLKDIPIVPIPPDTDGVTMDQDDPDGATEDFLFDQEDDHDSDF